MIICLKYTQFMYKIGHFRLWTVVCDETSITLPKCAKNHPKLGAFYDICLKYTQFM